MTVFALNPEAIIQGWLLKRLLLLTSKLQKIGTSPKVTTMVILKLCQKVKH